MNLIESIITACKAHHVAQIARIEARKDQIMAAFAEANQNLAPTIDCMGRFHAPCDGYVTSDSDNVYGKGEFLPTPEEFADEFSTYFGGSAPRNSARKAKVTIAVADRQQLTDGLRDVHATVSLGREFDRQGVRTANAYIACSVGMYNVIMAVTAEHKEAEQASLKALKGVAPEGRVEVTGHIASIYTQQNMFNGGIDLKMLVVLLNGATAYGTIPARMAGLVEVGDEVYFKATFKHADNDNTHAFFSRPV